MSNPIHQLKKLLAPHPSSPTHGKVVATTGEYANVATTQGMVFLPNNGGYKAGDEVVLRGGGIQGRRLSDSSIETFML
jgi:hypothetical protein